MTSNKSSVNKMTLEAILNRLSEENNISMDDIKNQIKDIYEFPTPWASEQAKDKAKEHNLTAEDIKPTGKGKKITLEDVMKKIGKEKTSSLGDFSSKMAKDLAENNGLTDKSFEKENRTGIDRKTNEKNKISIGDVRKLIIKLKLNDIENNDNDSSESE